MVAVLTPCVLIGGLGAARADDAPEVPPAAAPQGDAPDGAPGTVAARPPAAGTDDDARAAPTGRFELAAGFDPDDGFVFGAAVAQDDLFHTGQRLALSAELSARAQAFRLTHGVDDVLGTGLDLRTELFDVRRAYPGFTRDGAGGAITLGHAVDAHTRGYLRYQLEQVALEPGGGPVTGRDLGVAGRDLGDGRIATLRAGLVRDTLDAPTLPRHGRRVELFAEAADPRLGSEHGFVQLGGSFDDARPLGPFTLRLHGHGSYIRSDDPGGVPLAVRLQHDGHVDGRGYPIGSIGTTMWTPAGVVATGDNLEAVGRVELELPVWSRVGLSVAGFADAALRGNTDAAWGPTGLTAFRSVGASILWRSPLGPLRFDWAVPLDATDPTPQFLFSFGGAL